MSLEKNNEAVLKQTDLDKSLASFYYLIMQAQDRSGLPRLTFHDAEYNETYCMRIEKSNLGYSVSGTLNGAIAYQLNHKIFDFNCKVKEVINAIAGGDAFA